MGLQYSPVLSITTCVQPHSTSHSHNCSKHWLVVGYLRISACASPLAGPFSTHTAIHFLPTSMPAQHSSTAEIIFASCPKRRPTLTTHKLFREPKLNLGDVQRRPDQVHHRGMRRHYAGGFLRPGDSSMHPLPDRRMHPLFHDLRVAARPWVVHRQPSIRADFASVIFVSPTIATPPFISAARSKI